MRGSIDTWVSTSSCEVAGRNAQAEPEGERSEYPYE